MAKGTKGGPKSSQGIKKAIMGPGPNKHLDSGAAGLIKVSGKNRKPVPPNK